MTRFALALVTAPDARAGARVAEALVARRLAACVNLLPVLRSVYRWKGRIHRHREVLLIAKTRRALFPRLLRAVRATHPADVPEVLLVPVERGSPPYLAWVSQNTR